MVANPNSRLVFDFPDPSPRFELDDNKNKSPTNSPIKKNKRFSKLGKKFTTPTKKFGIGNNSSASSPSKDSLDGNDTALTSLNSSLNSNTASPERLQRNNSGDKAAGLSPGNNKQFTFADSPSRPGPQSTKLNLLPTIGSNPKHVRDPSVASGFISEVSEFSFDRVTVATNDTEGVMTGQSSNVSWNFLDESILQTVGVAAGGLQGGKSSLLGDKGCVPYTGQQQQGNNMAAEANLLANAKAQSMTKRHHSKVSTSTFDNVSLDTEEEDNLFNDEKYGYTSSSTQNQLGMAKPGDNGSVISEISDRTGGRNAAANPDERVKALLREGMAATKANAASAPRVPPPSPTTSKTSKLTDQDNTQNTSKGTFTWNEIKHNYTTFKTSRNNGLKEKSNGSILSSIIEDVQFCGLYFCGIDTTTCGDDEAKAKYEENLKLKKMDRKREADDTFLGSVISCVPSSVAQCGVDDARNVFEDSCVPSSSALAQCGGR